MTSLMCSADRQEIESLKNKLFRAGIRSEIRSDPLASKLGVPLFEIFVDERDLLKAAKIRQDLESAASAQDAAGSPGGHMTISGSAKSKEPELVTPDEVLPSRSTESPQPESPGRGSERGGAKPEGEFAQATARLEKEVEELLVAESKSADRCSSLEEKVKTLDESLAKARADLAREVSNRSSAEKKLAEVCEARALLEKEMQAIEVRFQASEQALAAAQARLESQTREFHVQQAANANLKQEVSSRDAQVERMAESLAQARAGVEQERNLRLAAEQKSGELAEVRKSLEYQLAQQAKQREQLLNERRNEQEQIRVCVGKVNELSSRVRAMLAAREKQ